MGTATGSNGRLKAPPGAPEAEDWIRSMVGQLGAAALPSAEEILLDIDVDQARYVLVRMPRIDRTAVALSPREREIVHLVALGYSNKAVADALSISIWTVGTYLRRIFAKLGVGSRAAMVARISFGVEP